MDGFSKTHQGERAHEEQTHRSFFNHVEASHQYGHKQDQEAAAAKTSHGDAYKQDENDEYEEYEIKSQCCQQRRTEGQTVNVQLTSNEW